MAVTQYYGTGRRKSSVARVYLRPGTGKITVNKKDINEYFGGQEILKVIIKQPLTATENLEKFDIFVNVNGGGFSGQAGAKAWLYSLGTGAIQETPKTEAHPARIIITLRK